MKHILRYLPILAIFACTAAAQSDDYKNQPGFVDFGGARAILPLSRLLRARLQLQTLLNDYAPETQK